MWTNKYAISLVKDNRLLDLVIVEEESPRKFDTQCFKAYRALRILHPEEPAELFSIYQLRKKPECAKANLKDPLPPGALSIGSLST